MGGSDFESEEGEEVAGTNIADPGAGGSKHTGFRPILHGFVPSRPVIPVVDVGPGSPYILYPWIIPPYSGLLDDGATTTTTG